MLDIDELTQELQGEEEKQMQDKKRLATIVENDISDTVELFEESLTSKGVLGLDSGYDVKEDIDTLLKKLREHKKRQFDRVLPINELLSDRWEKARYINAGQGTTIYDSAYIFGDVKIGKNVFVGAYTCLEGTGGLVVGDYCNISFGVHIYTHNSVESCLTGGKAQFKRGSVIIGERTYLAPMVVVTAGAKIGKECVIGAFSLVNKDIPDNSIVFGVPAKVIGRTVINGEKVTMDYYKK